MGLDIYYRKFKKNDEISLDVKDGWGDIYNECERQSREKFAKVYDSVLSSLKKADNYEEAYKKGIKKICKFSNYPQFDYNKLGVSYDYSTHQYNYTTTPIEVFERERNEIISNHYAPYIAYFRKANFVYAYFQDKLIDEIAWVTRDDLIDLIDRCKKVLEDHTLAEKLLPTRSGFFFGSTEYDDWYYNDVKDCKKQMEKLLKGFKDDELMYVSMSW
jgi:hypothetical protein